MGGPRDTNRSKLLPNFQLRSCFQRNTNSWCRPVTIGPRPVMTRSSTWSSAQLPSRRKNQREVGTTNTKERRGSLWTVFPPNARLGRCLIQKYGCNHPGMPIWRSRQVFHTRKGFTKDTLAAHWSVGWNARPSEYAERKGSCAHTQKASLTLGFEHVSEGSMPNHGCDKVSKHTLCRCHHGWYHSKCCLNNH